MSATGSPKVPMRALVEFDGSVGVQSGSGPVALSLRGVAARNSMPLQLLFSGVTQLSPAPPPSLHAVRVFELETAEPIAPSSQLTRAARRFGIDAREGQYSLLARGLQLHANASGAFFAALPRTRVAPARRWGWALLLSLLRVLPVVRLISRRRV